MPHEQYTPEQEKNIEDSRIIYEAGGPSNEIHMQREAEVENEFRDLLKKRGMEIPDIDLIKKVEVGDFEFKNSISITTISMSVYRLWTGEHRGEYLLRMPEVIHASSDEDLKKGYKEGDVTGVRFTNMDSHKEDEWRRMHPIEYKMFMGKYQPTLLAEVYMQAEYIVNKRDGYLKEKKYGDLSW